MLTVNWYTLEAHTTGYMLELVTCKACLGQAWTLQVTPAHCNTNFLTRVFNFGLYFVKLRESAFMESEHTAKIYMYMHCEPPVYSLVWGLLRLARKMLHYQSLRKSSASSPNFAIDSMGTNNTNVSLQCTEICRTYMGAPRNRDAHVESALWWTLATCFSPFFRIPNYTCCLSNNFP